MKRLLLPALLLAAASAGAVTPLWMRDVKISPDGRHIAFTYKGDIYRVPVAGGQAQRLTTQPSMEKYPIWSPDGTKIAFASDREGGLDIYVMDANGGEAKRLTFNSAREIPEAFTPDGSAVVFEASIQDAPASLMFPSARLTELYQVPVAGGTTTQILSTPVQMLSYLPDGKSFVYQDQKGMENEWRKHHTSSVTRDIWLYDAATGTHKNLTSHAGEDRNPVAAGETVYFLSERGDGKSMNVYAMDLSSPQTVKAVTDFQTHPVRFLSRGADGTLAFTYDGEIYTMRPGQKPVKVPISLTRDDDDAIEEVGVRSISDGAVSPDGKQVALVSRGEVLVTSVDYPTTKVVTQTPQAEDNVSWLDDRTLFYSSERDGKVRIYKATIARSEDPNFPNATIIEETAVTPDDGVERSNPQVSPDGKKVAYFKDRNHLAVMDLASGKETQLTDDKLQPRRDPFNFQWSPDSRWIAAEVVDRLHDPYTDIAVINAETGDYRNITGSGYFDQNPRWVMGGDAIIFDSERFGMRNHASWGSMSDVLMAFTNQEAFDKYRLSEEDYALLKETEKANKKDEPADKKDKKGKKGKKGKKDDKAKDEESQKAKFDLASLDGMKDRMVRLTPFSSSLASYYVTDDGNKLYFIAQTDKDYELWSKDLRKGDTEVVTSIGEAMSMEPDKEGKNLFLFGPGGVKKLELASDKLKPVTWNASLKVDPAREREYMYDYVLREEGERFYDKGMHGVDWTALGEAYRKFLPHINNNGDFSDMLSELLGELNVSHTGSGYRGPSANDPTASLGLLYDMTYGGDGWKVAEIIKYGPFDRADSKMVPGSIVTSVNGKAVAQGDEILNDLARKKTLVEFTTPAGKKMSEVILPIAAPQEQALLYKRWVRRNEELVDSLSGGRLGYVHIESMADDSFRPLYSAVLGKYNDRDGIIIDTRWNGGGRMHEDIEIMFSGKKYLTQVIRGVESCDMPSRRWNKPSVMLTAEANYSNAHGTPWVYQTMGLGKVIGAPVPGTMTSVNWVTLQDPSLYFGIPVIGYKTDQGNYLENTQLQPDIMVLNNPEEIVKGNDAQLKAAVDELLRETGK